MADSAGVSDAVITVKGSGITRIGADSSGNSRLSLARSGGIRGGVISTNASSVSLNTPVNNGTRTIVLGKDASDRLGVGTDAPQSTLHVVGDTVVDGGSWTISSDNSASPANSLVMSHTAAGGRLSATTPIVISKDNNGSKLTTMRDSIDDRGLARFWSRDAYAV